ncbi:MAG: nitrogen fixation protein NifE [Clostridiales bacterium]|jgi:nitrogenase molybdenum-iron protein alpha chain|nr:nitrogen fixation protein NifE [Clostridiales bacterium]
MANAAAKAIQDKIRDTRAGFTDAQAGEAGHLRDRAGRGCLRSARRTFEQGIQCVQVNSVNALASIQDSAMIIHAPYGCAACGSLGTLERINVYRRHMGDESGLSSRIFSSALGEKEVILGGEQRLEDAAREAVARHNPKIVFLLASCASAIIGDDIDMVADRLREEYPGTVFAPVHCEGFKSRNHATGYDLALSALQNYVIGDARPDRQEGLINLFATHSLSFADQREMKRMLRAIGLDANILPFNASYGDIMRIPAAEYNISVCQIFGDEYMAFLKERYGAPYVVTCMPIGSDSTDRWLRAIAGLAGREAEAEAFIARERAEVEGEIGRIRQKTDGLKVCITAGTGRGLAAATIMGEYRMKLLCMHAPYYEKAYVPDFERLEEYHGSDFLINVADMQPYEQINLIKKFRPDVFIGMANWVSRLGLPTTHILDGKRPTFGYRGVLYLGRKLEDALDNNNFNAKLKNFASPPFRESWYLEDAFKYMEFPEDEGGGDGGGGESGSEIGERILDISGKSGELNAARKLAGAGELAEAGKLAGASELAEAGKSAGASELAESGESSKLDAAGELAGASELAEAGRAGGRKPDGGAAA